MRKCPRCDYSYSKDVPNCIKCGYDPLRPSMSNLKESTSKGKILIGAGVILIVIIVSVVIGFGI